MSYSPFDMPFYSGENKFYLSEDRSLLVKKFLGSAASDDCLTAKERIALWDQHGIGFVEIFERNDLPHAENCLAMEYLEGCSLRELFKQSDVTVDQIKTISCDFFATVAERHQLALKQCDKRFVHPDPHLGNVLLTGRGLIYIDLDRKMPRYPILKTSVWELSRWGRSFVDLVGREYLDLVVDAVMSAYQNVPEVLHALVKQDYKPPRIQSLKERLRGQSSDTMRRYELAVEIKNALRKRKVTKSRA